MQLKIEDSKNYAESCVILHWSMTNVLSRFKRLNDFPHVLKRFFSSNVFTARRYASTVCAIAPCLSVPSRCSTKTAGHVITRYANNTRR